MASGDRGGTGGRGGKGDPRSAKCNQYRVKYDLGESQILPFATSSACAKYLSRSAVSLSSAGAACPRGRRRPPARRACVSPAKLLRRLRSPSQLHQHTPRRVDPVALGHVPFRHQRRAISDGSRASDGSRGQRRCGRRATVRGRGVDGSKGRATVLRRATVRGRTTVRGASDNSRGRRRQCVCGSQGLSNACLYRRSADSHSRVVCGRRSRVAVGVCRCGRRVRA